MADLQPAESAAKEFAW